MRLCLYIDKAKATSNAITLLQDYLYVHSIASCIYTIMFFQLQRSEQILPISFFLLCLLSSSSLFHPSSRTCINPQLGFSSLILTLLQPLLSHRLPPRFWSSRYTSAYCLHTPVIGVQCSINVCKTLIASVRRCGSRSKGSTRLDDRQSGLFL